MKSAGVRLCCVVVYTRHGVAGGRGVAMEVGHVGEGVCRRFGSVESRLSFGRCLQSSILYFRTWHHLDATFSLLAGVGRVQSLTSMMLCRLSTCRHPLVAGFGDDVFFVTKSATLLSRSRYMMERGDLMCLCIFGTLGHT